MTQHLTALHRHIHKNILEDDMMSLRQDHLGHETIELVKEGLLKDCETRLLSCLLHLLLGLLI